MSSGPAACPYCAFSSAYACAPTSFIPASSCGLAQPCGHASAVVSMAPGPPTSSIDVLIARCSHSTSIQRASRGASAASSGPTSACSALRSASAVSCDSFDAV